VTPPEIKGGDTHYKVIEVLDFEPAQEQEHLPLKKRRVAQKRKSRKATE
jgi:hypothetical protein